MAVTEITLGKSGDGKTYYVVYKLIKEWLPFSHNHIVYTNLPLNIDAIAIHYIEDHPDIVSSWITDRISIIQREPTKLWMEEKSGPWEYFQDKDLAGSRIVIDEIHNYVHIKSSQQYIHKWRQWLGELRHQGCECEFISQYETKIHPLIRHECGLKRVLESFNDKRDFVFWIKFYDHFQLVSKIRGYWSSRVWYSEWKPSTVNGAQWEKIGGGTVPLVPKYYGLYNSYSAPIAGHGKSSTIQPHPFQRMRWAELLSWYFTRNIYNVLLAFAAYGLLYYAFFCNGISNFFMSTFAPPTETTPSATASAPVKPGTSSTKSQATPNEPPPPPRPALYSPLGVFDAAGRPVLPLSPGHSD